MGNCTTRWFTDEAADCAWQVVAALLWREEEFEVGAYVAHRNLERAIGDKTEATAVDIYARWELPLASAAG